MREMKFCAEERNQIQKAKIHINLKYEKKISMRNIKQVHTAHQKEHDELQQRREENCKDFMGEKWKKNGGMEDRIEWYQKEV